MSFQIPCWIYLTIPLRSVLFSFCDNFSDPLNLFNAKMVPSTVVEHSSYWYSSYQCHLRVKFLKPTSWKFLMKVLDHSIQFSNLLMNVFHSMTYLDTHILVSCTPGCRPIPHKTLTLSGNQWWRGIYSNWLFFFICFLLHVFLQCLIMLEVFSMIILFL